MKLMVLAPNRKPLEAKAGGRIRVTDVYVRAGDRRDTGAHHGTVLVRDVRDAESGALLADHLWFNRGEVWRHAGLVAGDVISFQARPIEYRTGYRGPNRVRQALEPARRDYRLTPPEGLVVVARIRGKPGRAA